MSWQPMSQWGRDQYSSMAGWGNTPGGFQPTAGVAGVSGAGDLTGGQDAGFKLGWNMPTFQAGLQGLNTLGNVWGAWQAGKLAKDQLNFTKMVANTNLNNQIKSYNTALEDRARSRAAVEGQTAAQQQAYVDRNRLDRG